MRVVKQSDGWLIQPSTNRERVALEYLIEGLAQSYATPIMSDEPLASRSLFRVQTPNRAFSASPQTNNHSGQSPR